MKQTKHAVFLFFILCLGIGFPSLAQFSITGTVYDSSGSKPLESAFVGLEGTGRVATTNAQGGYAFTNVKPGRYAVKVAFVGFYPASIMVNVRENVVLPIKLSSKNTYSEEVIVKATRSQNLDPTTRVLIDKEDIAKVNLAQDLPVLIQMSPSVVSTSDAGAGVGYTGVSIRGSDATRINVTINGIPVNDAESHGVFWVNMPDFASSVNNIQIQRGVGTSTNGSAAFGASLNIQTSTLRKEAYAETNHSFGSFNTLKNNVLVGTGLIDGKWSVDARISRISSDGFIDRGASDLSSSYLSAGYYGKKGILKFNIISGSEKTYQAWNGIPEARLRGDKTEMLNYISRNFLGSSDSAHLVNSNSRTYNAFTYKDQTDNYRQNHFQLFYSYDLGNHWGLNTALHYTKGKGYYEEFKTGESFGKYGLSQPIIGNDTLESTDLIRQRWLDNDFYGGTYSIQYEKDKINFTLGGSANKYVGDHFGKVIWAQNSNLKDNNFEYYTNTATKNDFSNYAKIGYQITPKIRLYGDLQVRNVFYRFEGYDRNLQSTTQSANFLFINPKAGLTYQFSENQNAYISYAKSQREPVRDDFVNSSPSSRPKSEILHNVEAGWRFENNKFKSSVNVYGMYYRNQLVLTGQINDVGAYIRSNVKESMRTGVELDAQYKIQPTLYISGNLTLSRNQITQFNNYTDNYDNADGSQTLEVLKNTPIAFSPSLISAVELVWIPIKNLEAGLMGKSVGRSYLDNTGTKSRSLDPYQFLNLRASYRMYLPLVKEITVQALANNLLDNQYETNGYTFGYIAGGQRTTENFYFPQAGRNFLVGFSLKL